MERLLEQDPVAVTWWGTPIECLSALLRLVREGRLTVDELTDAERRLRELRDGWSEVLPSETCRRTAERMLRVHALRAADALQLAAAMVASDGEPTQLDLVCLDRRLAGAARKEGFALAVRL
jgi:predicted nucleic acid-binding protein